MAATAEPPLSSEPTAQSWTGASGTIAFLHHVITRLHPGRIAVVSSFGAESALLLALVAECDASCPVLFLDTGKHFTETLEYRRTVVAFLGLRDVRDVTPEATALAAADPAGDLHLYVPDDCCALRKIAPLERALAPFDAWITGRKRYQAGTRADMTPAEKIGCRTRYNPLADWSAAQIAAESAARGLPRHPLVAQGYPSIGCAPCTHAVAAGEDARSGRWPGHAKTECGIHRPRGFSEGGRSAEGIRFVDQAAQ
jgi:phosphoadenosine phosphosulfate reductase